MSVTVSGRGISSQAQTHQSGKGEVHPRGSGTGVEHRITSRSMGLSRIREFGRAQKQSSSCEKGSRSVEADWAEVRLRSTAKCPISGSPPTSKIRRSTEANFEKVSSTVSRCLYQIADKHTQCAKSGTFPEESGLVLERSLSSKSVGLHRVRRFSGARQRVTREIVRSSPDIDLSSQTQNHRCG